MLPPPRSGTAAAVLEPLLELYFPGGPPLRFEFWDGSALGPDRVAGRIRVRSPLALRRMVWAPGELGLGRAFVTGELEIDGDIIEVLGMLEQEATSHGPSARRVLRAARAAR